MPVDLYIGGAEHAVLHLLYSRFWHKVLFDLGYVATPEPIRRLFNQGMITADAFQDERGVYVDIREVEFRDGEPYQTGTGKPLTRTAGKMGKRYKNGLPPEEVGEEYGVDTLRLYEMYMGPLEASTPWSMEGIRGMQRFLQRVWRNLVDADRGLRVGGEATPELRRLLHRTIARVTDDVENLRFNTAIAALIELNNELVALPAVPAEVARTFLLLLAPFAPHLAEEVWELGGFGAGSISTVPWPEADPRLLVREMVTLPVQVNGKVRANVEAPAQIDEAALRELVFANEGVRRYVPDPAKIKRFVLVPGRIVNIVV
jgi:leucyl-tRNA synthetase